MSEDKKTMKEVIKELNKKFGRTSINFADTVKTRTRIPFKQKYLNDLTGGGVPCGQFTTIWGGSACGKSSIVLDLIAEAQKRGLTCVYCDLEHSYDPKWAAKHGVDASKLVYGDFGSAEEPMDALIAFCKAQVADLIIVDSIQGLSPKGEQEEKSGKEKSVQDDTMALLARKLSQFFRMSAGLVSQSNTAVVLVGQTRMDLGSFIKLETLSGGHALLHWSSIILHLRRGQKCYSEDTRVVTINGPKGIDELKVGELIPTINQETGLTELNPVEEIFKYNNFENCGYFSNKQNKDGWIFTPGHKLALINHKSGKLEIKENYLLPQYTKRGLIRFPNCAPCSYAEYPPISDRFIKLLGWFLSDGYLDKAGAISISQSLNPKKHANKIENLLKEILQDGLIYNSRTRRKKEYTLKNGDIVTSPYEIKEWRFTVAASKELLKLWGIYNRKELPKFLYYMSDRQIKVLFDSWMLGDGSNYGKRWKITDGNRELLEQLTGVLIMHGIPVSRIKAYKDKQAFDISGSVAQSEGFLRSWGPYVGRVWCIKVKNQLHFIERKGSFIFTHNSDAPTTEIVNEEGKKEKVIIGFNCVIKLNKCKVSGAVEGNEMSLPFYFGSGLTDGEAPEVISVEEKPNIVVEAPKKKRGRKLKVA